MFGGVWRILRDAGWTSKRPSRNSLSDMYLYIPPNGDVNGVEGKDFFLGERPLLEHYRRTCIVRSQARDTDVSDLTSSGDVSAEVVAGTCFSDQRGGHDLNLTSTGDVRGSASDVAAERVDAHGDEIAQVFGDNSLNVRGDDITGSLDGYSAGLACGRSKR